MTPVKVEAIGIAQYSDQPSPGVFTHENMSATRLDAVYELIRSRPNLYYKANDFKRGYQHQQTSLFLMYEIYDEGMFISYFVLFCVMLLIALSAEPHQYKAISFDSLGLVISTVLLCLQIM